MNRELAGKVAIVTGGASGLGRATAELFVEEGARVVIADIDADSGQALAENNSEHMVFKQTDVADPVQVQSLVDFAVSRFGALDVMFNNAGISGSRKLARFLDDDLEDFDRVVAVNLYGVIIGSQCAGRHMAKNGGGAIINTTSIAALKPGGGLVAYRASKAGVIHFTRSVALDLAEYGIRVNCIAPGQIPAGMTFYDMSEIIRTTQPLQRQGEARDVANAALYLASERSAHVTGLVLPVDGGANVGRPFRPPAAAINP